MLPDCRKKKGDIFSIPKLTVKKEGEDSFMKELRTFHGKFRDCSLRNETRLSL